MEFFPKLNLSGDLFKFFTLILQVHGFIHEVVQILDNFSDVSMEFFDTFVELELGSTKKEKLEAVREAKQTG